jgi:hypothetical protein
MADRIEDLIRQHTRAKTIKFEDSLQSLWSGYGSIDRYTLTGFKNPSIIVKHVRIPNKKNHPRGWNTNLSHLRKLKSYRIESYWYEHYSSLCDNQCRIPDIFAIEQSEDEFIMVMEDLDAMDFSRRKTSANFQEMQICLNWLAAFHARFMRHDPSGLWPVGSYWHLDTRPDELLAMPDGALKINAAKIDQLLNDSPFKTIIHGDAKLANFCFSETLREVAAVDFQYVGGGIGMKDLVYFISSCMDENECAQFDQKLLDRYFGFLQQHLSHYQPDIDANLVEQSWRPLYAVACTDFLRFLQGWSPGHWKIHQYSQDMANKVIRSL